MVLKLFPRGFATATSAISTIRAQTHTHKQTLNYAAPVLLAGGCLAYAFSGSNDKDKPERGIRAVPTRDLIRGYLVYAACSIPALIDASPAILHAFGSSPIPGLPALANTVVRHTFFAQFVPGETVEECMPILAQMHNQNVGGALNYCAEAEQGELDHTAVRDAKELNRCLAECYKGIEELGKLEDQIEAAGGRRGASAFAVKVVSRDGRLEARQLVLTCQDGPSGQWRLGPRFKHSDALPFSCAGRRYCTVPWATYVNRRHCRCLRARIHRPGPHLRRLAPATRAPPL